jgi:hypothetical protein
MTNDPNVPPHQPEPQPGQFQPPYQGQGQPFQPQQWQPQPGMFPQPHPGQPYPPQYQQGHYPPPPLGPQPPQQRQRDANQPPRRFGVSFWIVGGLLLIPVLTNTFTGHGESILVILGIAALLTGLYALIFKKRSWASLPGRNAAVTVAIAGAASLLIGGIAAGVNGSRENTVAAPEGATSATLEADAAAKLKTREDALVKSEADSAAKLTVREEAVKKAEEAVKAREAAAGAAEASAAANTIKEGTWTVGKDIVPGDYRTTKEVMDGCSWKITRTGSNGSDYIDYDFFVKGGFPMVTLVDGQTFETEGCGNWAKQ